MSVRLYSYWVLGAGNGENGSEYIYHSVSIIATYELCLKCYKHSAQNIDYSVIRINTVSSYNHADEFIYTVFNVVYW